ncbi:MAG: HAMP domain-containing histidine kinase [Xylanivirga thermophila]|uniref:sensor histidine kinase n=1 Tax=Xylanivirga thermophila TaxID=2496273 RepID=UPI0039F4A0CD
MFDKLRNKFLWFTMGILTLVFFIIFTVVFISTTIKVQHQIDMTLNNIMHTPNHKISLHDPLYTSSISVELSKDGDILDIRSFVEVDMPILTETLSIVTHNNNFRGTVTMDGNRFAYLKKDMPFGSKIVLVSRTIYDNTINTLLFTFIVVGALSLGILFVISWFFANKAIEPVKMAFEHQKQFVADASHELKTPLTIINTNLDLISSNGNQTVNEQHKWIGYIYTQVDRMSKLINDMLMLARMDEYKMIFSKVNFSDILNNALLYFEVALYEKNITLEQNIYEDIYVLGDTASLEKLIYILLENTLKYSPKNEKVSVTLTHEKSKLVLKIRNTGISIPSEHIDKIFDRFYRADSARTQKNGGYGLGLAIAKSITTQHNGNIWAQSMPKSYTEFIVELPIV